MPICIECQHPAKTLWTQYSGAGDQSSGHYIRLTVCPQCGLFCDKYVEHDFIVIFIDMVLIKPQVYRHLLHNSLMRDGDRFDPSIIRLGILLLLFDVYLTWARIEKQTTPVTMTGESNIGKLAQQPIVLQYLFFGMTSLTPLFAQPCLFSDFVHSFDHGIPYKHSNTRFLTVLAALLAGPYEASHKPKLSVNSPPRVLINQTLSHSYGHLGIRRSRRSPISWLGCRGQQC